MGCNFSTSLVKGKTYDKVPNKDNNTPAKKTPANDKSPFQKPIQDDFIASKEYSNINKPVNFNIRCDSEGGIIDDSTAKSTDVSTTFSLSNESSVPTESTEFACFGAGCYWGTEKYFKHDFAAKSVALGNIVKGEVGFMGPKTAPENPSYKEVCSGLTGHVEVYNFEYTGGAQFFEAAVRYFFQFHDPTVLNRQGNDRGTQYASVIYCSTDEQMEIAYRVRIELQERIDTGKLSCYQQKRVTTDVRKSTIFYPAHEEHQNYLINNPNGYCNHRIRFKEW
eukprot:gene25329-33862_t